MIEYIVANLICPFLELLLFRSVNVPKRFYLSCGITGTMGWIVYCLTVNLTSAAIASFWEHWW